MRQFFFNLTLAFRAIRTNRLRSVLTITIIGLGIMALVGILTAKDVMQQAIETNLSSMGVNSFQIINEVVKKKSHRGRRTSVEKNITFDEARAFRERFTFPSIVSISVDGTSIATVHHESEKTNPNVHITGVEETYLAAVDTKLDAGRNFSVSEIQSGSYTCILGSGVAKKLFKQNPNAAINNTVSIGDVKYQVIGVMESKGGSMNGDNDNAVIIPLNTARALYGGDNSYLITVIVPDVKMKDFAGEEAEGLFRVIRKLPLGGNDNFSITQNNELVSIVLDSTKYVRWAGVIIGIITLLGSVIGLMNIMLVSVAERTREIGVSKALGARSSIIKRQFLTESILISLMGGAVGIIFGMLIGNVIGMFFHTGFVVPWLWIIMGVSLCAVVGMISGIYPAMKAAKLDPIVALRYE